MGALEDALSGGPPSGEPKAGPVNGGEEDMEILYEEFKGAKDSKAALAALRQLVKGLK